MHPQAGTEILCLYDAARKLRTSPLLMPPPPKLVVVTAVHDQPCTYPRGDYLNYISVLNKQVCRLSCEVVIGHTLSKAVTVQT